MPNLHNTYPCGVDGKESTCNKGESGPVPGSERSPGEGNGNPLQHSCLENSMDKEIFVLPQRAKRLNQSNLKEINPEYSLEGLMLMLKYQYLAT